MAKSLRLVVIDFEDPPEDLLKRYGTYGDIVTGLLLRETDGTTRPEVSITKCNVIKGETLPAVDSFDAVVIPGSKHTAHEDDPWVPELSAFINRAYQAQKPLFGICYGHQLMGRALGGEAGVNPKGWEVCVTDVNLSSNGESLFGSNKMSIHQMHRDAVIKLPPNVEAIGSSSNCDVQIMYQPGRVLGFQGHPEFDYFIAKALLEQRLDSGLITKEVFDDAMAKAKLGHDAPRAANGIWGFLIGLDRL